MVAISTFMAPMMPIFSVMVLGFSQTVQRALMIAQRRRPLA
jgi:hypothetical protein